MRRNADRGEKVRTPQREPLLRGGTAESHEHARAQQAKFRRRPGAARLDVARV